MRKSKGLARLLLCGVGILALQTTAQAQTTSGSIETVTVTGSLVISNGINSPTPVTGLTANQLEALSPSNISDALIKVPQFANSTSQQSYGSLKINNNSSFLNLRGFGISRTLVLMDGGRIVGIGQNGWVDANLLPNMLVSRVDIVTGGASATYGSDAIVGVVNYVINHRFNGLKFEGQGGISNYGDDASWKVGIAAGTDLFDGRGHVEGSYQHYHSAGIPNNFDRPHGAQLWDEVGAGTAANPFNLVKDVRYNYALHYPTIMTGPLAGQMFTANGVLQPLNLGTPTGTPGLYSGGDGGYSAGRTLVSPLTTDKVFGRFDYDFTNNISGFAEVMYERAVSGNDWFSPGFGTFLPFPNALVTNPYLPSAIATQLTTAGVHVFRVAGFLNRPPWHSTYTDENLDVVVGFKGSAFNNRVHWNIHYTHGHSSDANDATNVNMGREFAALDTISVGGQIECRVAVTNPTGYPGCQPLNPFVPVAQQSAAAISWIDQATHYDITNTMDDVAGSVRGDLFDLPAGPVSAAVQAEYRRLRYKIEGSPQGLGTAKVDCTGIAIGCAPVPEWLVAALPPQEASEKVVEGALELNVPVVKDLPLIKELSVNGAVRYARYIHAPKNFTTTTWKAGVNWRINDSIRLRGTMSRDMRAPTLSDLYAPQSNQAFNFFDVHTGVVANGTLVVGGNPDLVPEVAHSLTLGFVFTPTWLPGFSFTEDYYKIKLSRGIFDLKGNTQTEDQLCEASGGTSPACALYVRPFPFSNHTPANAPTTIYSQEINVASERTSGFDTELNYAADLGELGSLTSRLLVVYQPIYKVVTQPGVATLNYAGVAGAGNPTVAQGMAKWRFNFAVSYFYDNWTFSAAERWRSSLKQSADKSLVYKNGRVASMDYTDLGIQYSITDWAAQSFGEKLQDANIFLTIENVFNRQPPLFYDTLYSGGPGETFPSVEGESAVGRYWTAGIRLRF